MKQDFNNNLNDGMNRRKFVGLGLGVAATSVLVRSSAAQEGIGQPRTTVGKSPEPMGRRKLGRLEVSGVGVCVQNITRRYETTVPDRLEMIHIIRTAFNEGVTFYDAAEAYGPHEVERVLGEGVAPFRDKVQIATKFGWNIDQETGERRPGLNSKPEHVKQVVEGMLKRLRTDRIDLLYQHRVDPAVPIEDVAGVVQQLRSEE